MYGYRPGDCDRKSAANHQRRSGPVDLCRTNDYAFRFRRCFVHLGQWRNQRHTIYSCCQRNIYRYRNGCQRMCKHRPGQRNHHTVAGRKRRTRSNDLYRKSCDAFRIRRQQLYMGQRRDGWRSIYTNSNNYLYRHRNNHQRMCEHRPGNHYHCTASNS